jgi:hypothetical protein
MAAHVALGLLSVLQEDTTQAVQCLRYFLRTKGHFIATEWGGKSADAMAGLLCTVLGRLGEAAGHFEDALAFCRRGGYRPELAWTLYSYAETLIERSARGDGKRADKLLEEGRALASELEMRPLMARIDHILG